MSNEIYKHSQPSKKAKPLTKKEKAWVAELEIVFSKCPSERLGVFTIGDCELNFFDKNINDPGVEDGRQWTLGSVETPMNIEGVCG